MCYNASQLAKKAFDEAKRFGASPEEIQRLFDRWQTIVRELEIKGEIVDYYQVSGFDHPKLFLYTKIGGVLELEHFTWGLIPHWVKDGDSADRLANQTLNARGETIWEKASFKDAAIDQRCIIPLDGVFEHKHVGKEKIPHFIYRKDGQRLLTAGLFSHWTDPKTMQDHCTFSIVTTNGNDVFTDIHNNPKIAGPRMPLFLDEENAVKWMEQAPFIAEELIKPFPDSELKAFPVQKVKDGKKWANTSDAHIPMETQGSLF